MSHYILAIDQGTTSSRAIVFDESYKICGIGQQEFPQHFPQSGWVEHDPNDILTTTIDTARTAIEKAGLQGADITAIGITNQRETTIIWDKKTGKPIYNAIVWQDRRTAKFCDTLKAQGHEPLFKEHTGLLLDPYFSGTKISWILNHVAGATRRAEQGELLFGTVDTWLLWNLSKNHQHATDATNASRTLLFDIKQQAWSEELLAILGVPAALLPTVKDCAAEFGVTDKRWFGAEIPILGMAGDQHAATLGQACFKPGMMKSTYGTGCFAMLNTGHAFIPSHNRLLTTTAYRLNGKTTYALEGSIFIAGAAVQWLRDGLGIIQHASECDQLAATSDPHQAVYLVPAFTGLGAPYWDADARGLLCGLTRSTSPKEIARATLEAVCYQTADLLSAMQDDWSRTILEIPKNTRLRVDGGMTASNWTMQMLANILDAPVDRPIILETTALGAAWLAGHYASVWDDAEAFASSWKLEQTFMPDMDNSQREKKIAGWKDAIKRTLTQ